MKIKISILGSTGSIGCNTLDLLNKKKSSFKIKFLSANKNFNIICQQIKKFKPEFYLINNSNIYKKVKKKFKNKNIKILNSFEEIDQRLKSDITVAAIPGLAGLFPTLKMIKLSKKILLANKESVICGWNLINKISKKHNTKIIPVDSEHFSIFELIKNRNISEIKKVYLTASGGPFLNYPLRKLKNVKPIEATNHPKWKMGKKISVDSSTLINKILELIEAHKLFKIPIKKLDILLHPDSLVHAVVQFNNGLTKMIYHETSMKIPLANAIFDNKINIEFFSSKKNLLQSKFQKSIIFKKLRSKIFPIIKIKNRIIEHPSTPIIINSANETLVEQFLKKNIPFLAIAKIIMTIMRDKNYRKYAIQKPLNLKKIFIIDEWARKKTLEIINDKYA
jgi:1-deoxy-D-xylulose-5-phosphate reductoisomerase